MPHVDSHKAGTIFAVTDTVDPSGGHFSVVTPTQPPAA
jgi:hypothetical protein